MKKSLIALAVMAVAGTAFAQTVTLSGKLRFAYEDVSATSAAGVKTDKNGLKVTDGDFVLTAVEDLGAGLKMTASMAVQSRGRETAIAGRDASLTLSGGFGSVLIGSIEAGNGIIGLGGAGAPVYGLDNGKVLAAAGNTDILRYSTPNMAGFVGYLSLLDNTAGVTATVPAGVETLGMDSSAITQDATQIGMTYAGGPIAAAADYTSWSQNAVVAAATVIDNRLRVSGSYDLGMAKLGLGYEKREMRVATDDGSSDIVLGVAVPMGATTFGLNYGRRSVDGLSQKGTGIDLGVKYDLSKRTYVAAHYQKIKEAAAAGATQATENKFRIQLAHAF